MIPYFSDVIFNTRRLAPKEATTLQDTTTLTQRKSSEYSLPSEISSLLILVCLSTVVGDENTLLKVDKVQTYRTTESLPNRFPSTLPSLASSSSSSH